MWNKLVDILYRVLKTPYSQLTLIDAVTLGLFYGSILLFCAFIVVGGYIILLHVIAKFGKKKEGI